MAAFEAGAVTALVLVQTERADAVAAGVADIPGPIYGVFLTTALTGYKHSCIGFKFAAKIRVLPGMTKIVIRFSNENENENDNKLTKTITKTKTFLNTNHTN